MTTTAASNQIIPWRSTTKLKDLSERENIDISKVTHIPHFDSYTQSKYNIHHVHSPNAWMADYLFIRQDGDIIQRNYHLSDIELMPKDRRKGLLIILAFIHCNSRLFIAYIVKKRTQEAYEDIFAKIFDTNTTTPAQNQQLLEPQWGDNRFVIDTLITDYEPSFGKDVRTNDNGELYIVNDDSRRSQRMAEFYKERGIRHIGFNMNRTAQHSKLSIIDRMARTLRDMIFNIRRLNPTFKLNEETLKQLCRTYNTSPHATLTRAMGFPVTPQDAYYYRDLQNEISRRTMETNYETANAIVGEPIAIGDEVYVNEPRVFFKKRRNTVKDDPYEVIKYTSPGSFLIKNKNHPTDIIRYTRKDLVLPRKRF